MKRYQFIILVCLLFFTDMYAYEVAINPQTIYPGDTVELTIQYDHTIHGLYTTVANQSLTMIADQYINFESDTNILKKNIHIPQNLKEGNLDLIVYFLDSKGKEVTRSFPIIQKVPLYQSLGLFFSHSVNRLKSIIFIPYLYLPILILTISFFFKRKEQYNINQQINDSEWLFSQMSKHPNQVKNVLENWLKNSKNKKKT